MTREIDPNQFSAFRVRTIFIKSKICNTCNREKPLDQFNRRRKGVFNLRNTAEGRRNKCRECSIEYQRRYKADLRREL